MMAGGPVTWSSKRQTTVALSTVEAEYVAMSRCAQQMVWMHSWLDEVDIEHKLPGLIKGDNRGAIAFTKNRERFEEKEDRPQIEVCVRSYEICI